MKQYTKEIDGKWYISEQDEYGNSYPLDIDDTWVEVIRVDAKISAPLGLVEQLNKEVEYQKALPEIEEAKKYLADTDWYYTRKIETEKDVPTDVLAKRKEYRQLLLSKGL